MPALFVLIVVVGGYAAFLDGDARIPALARWGTATVVRSVSLRWILGRARDAIRLRAHLRRLERLRTFADRLPRGALSCPGFYSGGKVTVSGEVEGRPYELTVRLGERPVVIHELRLTPDVTDLDAFHPGALAIVLGAPPRIVYGDGAPPPALAPALSEHLVRRGFTNVSCACGVLRTRAPFSEKELVLERLVDASRSLARIARLLEPKPLRLESKTEEQRCPYCRNGIGADDALELCQGCRTVHHRDCYIEARGCTVLGCPSARPWKKRTAIKS